MKKLLFALSLALLFSRPGAAEAQKIGINVAAKHGDLDRAAATVGPGGWVTIMACPGDAGTLHDFLAAHPDINVVIRTHWPSTVPDRNWALSWTATLGKIDPNANRKIYIMPWNEPNMAREAGGSSNVGQVAGEVVAYINELSADLAAAGLLHTKIGLLSPMIDQSNDNFQRFVQALGGGDFFRQFDGITMNLYDHETNCDRPFCDPNSNGNASKYRQVLAQMGIPHHAKAKVFAVEVGIVNKGSSCGDRPDCPVFVGQAMANLLSQAKPIWDRDPNFIMASPLSYDPEQRDNPDWLWGSPVEGLISSWKTNGSVAAANWNLDAQNQFFDWLQAKINVGVLQACQNSNYGYVVSARPEICRSACGGGGSNSHPITELKRAGTAEGTSFTIRKMVCLNSSNHWNYDAAIRAIVKALNNKEPITKNKKMAKTLKGANEKLLPPGEENQGQANSSPAKIRFKVCADNQQFDVPEGITVTLPSSYQRAATNGQQVAGFMTPPGDEIQPLLDSNTDPKKVEEIVHKFIPPPQRQEAPDICPNIGFKVWVDDGQLCWQIKGQTYSRTTACSWGYRIVLSGQNVPTPDANGQEEIANLPSIDPSDTNTNCLAQPEPIKITCHNGGAHPFPYPGGDVRVGLQITKIGTSVPGCKENLSTLFAVCHQNEDGTVECPDNGSGSAGNGGSCQRNNATGIEIPYEELFAKGQSKLDNLSVGSLLNISRSYLNWLLEKLATLTPICRQVDFVFTPVTSVSFTMPDSTIQRLGIFARLAPPETKDLEFKHSQTTGEFHVDVGGQGSSASPSLDIFGQGGVHNSYNFTIDELTPPRI